MLTKRVIPCLDVRNGRVTKGVKFKNNVDLGDPVEMAVAYSEGGADELVFYDITASAEHRPIDLGMVEAVARAVRIPFAVGGGISSLADMERVILAGAEKVSVNSLAVRNPQIVADGAKAFGAQCIVLGMDPVRSARCPSGYEITTRGFREFTGMDAVEWAKRAADLGAGEIVVNSVDADGTRDGFELDLTRRIAEAVPVPVVASGGAGRPEHLVTVFREAKADAAIVAGMIHFGDYTIAQIKDAAAVHAKLKPIHDTFMKKNFKLTKDAYAAQHKEELDTFNKAVRTLMKLNGSTAVDFSALDAEFSALQSSSAELRTQLETLQPDISALKNIRKYIDMVLNKQQLSAPGGKTPEKESVLKKLEQFQQKKSHHKTTSTPPNREESL